MSPSQDEDPQADADEQQDGGQRLLTVGQITEKEIPGGAVTTYLARIGFRLAIALLLLIASVFIWVGVYASGLVYTPTSHNRRRSQRSGRHSQKTTPL